MKKCGSCTKDLPDAALHCVFCGAKQPPAPASTPAMAKTVMGYSGNAELDALRANAAARAKQASTPPVSAPAAAPFAPRGNPSQHPPMGGPPPLAPAAAASAKTMFVPGGPGQGAAPGPMGPGPGPMGPGPGPMGPGPGPVGPGPGPVGPGPMPAGAYGASVRPAPLVQPAPIQPVPHAAHYQQEPAQAGRPIEPWKDTLRLMLLVWGGLLLAAFVTPLALDPLTFNWDLIIDGEGTAKLLPMILAAVGLLSVVIALVPLTAAARGGIGLALGLAGVFVPVALMLVDAGEIPIELLIMMLGYLVGMLLLVPSLLARSEYREAMLPRVLITVGAILALLPMLMPVNGSIGLVEVFTQVIDAEGVGKVIALLALAQVVVIVLALLAWLPSPAGAAAKPIAWLLILWGLIIHAANLFLVGDPSMIEAAPYAGAMSWIAGGGGAAVPGLGVAYLAIVGYCGATVLGKQLE